MGLRGFWFLDYLKMLHTDYAALSDSFVRYFKDQNFWHLAENITS